MLLAARGNLPQQSCSLRISRTTRTTANQSVSFWWLLRGRWLLPPRTFICWAKSFGPQWGENSHQSNKTIEAFYFCLIRSALTCHHCQSMQKILGLWEHGWHLKQLPHLFYFSSFFHPSLSYLNVIRLSNQRIVFSLSFILTSSTSVVCWIFFKQPVISLGGWLVSLLNNYPLCRNLLNIQAGHIHSNEALLGSISTNRDMRCKLSTRLRDLTSGWIRFDNRALSRVLFHYVRQQKRMGSSNSTNLNLGVLSVQLN